MEEKTPVMESPLISMGQIAALRVKALTDIGAFLDWGRPKDLLLPFHEQRGKLYQGQTVVVGLYTDRSGRPAASMKLKRFVSDEAPDLRRDASVEALIYEVRPGTGALAVARKDEDSPWHFGLIPEQDYRGRLDVGDMLTVRVTRVREDGRLDLSPRKKAYKQIDTDAGMILDMIKDAGGRLGFDEKADPEFIKERTGLSKAAFKRAVGRLMRDALIEEKDGDIFLC